MENIATVIKALYEKVSGDEVLKKAGFNIDNEESSEENSKSAVKIIIENACMDAVKPVNATEKCWHDATEDKTFFQATGLKRIKRQSLNR